MWVQARMVAGITAGIAGGMHLSEIASEIAHEERPFIPCFVHETDLGMYAQGQSGHLTSIVETYPSALRKQRLQQRLPAKVLTKPFACVSRADGIVRPNQVKNGNRYNS